MCRKKSTRASSSSRRKRGEGRKGREFSGINYCWCLHASRLSSRARTDESICTYRSVAITVWLSQLEVFSKPESGSRIGGVE
jgi:hypothetical protein